MAKEYIEREALCESLNARLKQLRDDYGYYDHYTDGFEECVDRIDDLLAADVVEVVRCKDCKYCFDSECLQLKNRVVRKVPVFGNHYSYCSPLKVTDDHFCSYGERRE